MFKREFLGLVSILCVVGVFALTFVVTDALGERYKRVKNHMIETWCILMVLMFCPAINVYQNYASFKLQEVKTAFYMDDDRGAVVLETKAYKSPLFGCTYETKDITSDFEVVEDTSTKDDSKEQSKYLNVSTNDDGQTVIKIKYKDNEAEKKTAAVSEGTGTTILNHEDGSTTIFCSLKPSSSRGYVETSDSDSGTATVVHDDGSVTNFCSLKRPTAQKEAEVQNSDAVTQNGKETYTYPNTND